MNDLRIAVDDVELVADWTDGSPDTRRAVEDVLPLAGDAARWGDELYFETPVDVPVEDAETVVPAGAVAYWPAGNALCLFWGPTPASEEEEPRAASPVNVVAQVDEVSALTRVSGGARMRIERS